MQGRFGRPERQNGESMEKIKEQNVHKKFTPRQNALRLYVMEQIINDGEFHIADGREGAMQALSMSKAEYDACMEVLRFQDGLVTDEEENVTFIYPVSALPTKHHVRLADGRTLCANCAIDAIGVPFTLRQDAVIDSECAVCGEPIHIEIKDGKVISYSPETLHALTFPLAEITNWAGSC